MLPRLARAALTGLALVGALGLSGFAADAAVSPGAAGRLLALALGAALAEVAAEALVARRRRRRAGGLELPPRGGRRIVVTTTGTGTPVEL